MDGVRSIRAVVRLTTDVAEVVDVPAKVRMYRPSLMRFVAQSSSSRKRRATWAQSTVTKALNADLAAGVVAVEPASWTPELLASPKGVTTLTFPVAE